MSRLIITNSDEYFNSLNSINENCGFRNSGRITDTFNFTNYKKINFDNENFLKLTDGYIGIAGTLAYKGQVGRVSLEMMYADYIAYGIKYVREHTFGTYVVAIQHEGELNLFIDESGNYAIYYYWKDGQYLITNLLYHIKKVTKDTVDSQTLMEELNEYCILDNKTYLSSTKRLMGNEILTIAAGKNEINVANVGMNEYSLYARTFDKNVSVLAKTIKKYAEMQKVISDKKVIFMTGGMDSRLTLAGDLAVGYKPNLANWQGSPVYMNTKYEDHIVCKKIADAKSLKFIPIDVSGDESHIIDNDMFDMLGEYATIYGNNLKWHTIFTTLKYNFYDFGYFGETLKEWAPLDLCYHDKFSIDDYADLYLGRQKHRYTNISSDTVKKYRQIIVDKLRKICKDHAIDCHNLSKEDCMLLYYYYRTHADTKMVNFANIYGYSINLYAQKELIDYINQTPYEYKEYGKLNLALTKVLCSELLSIPYFSHCHYMNYIPEKMILDDPAVTSTSARLKRAIPTPIKSVLKKLLRKSGNQVYIKEVIDRFDLNSIDVGWLAKVDENTYSSVGEYKAYFDYYTMLKKVQS